MCGICAKFGVNLHQTDDLAVGDIAPVQGTSLDAATFNATFDSSGPGLPDLPVVGSTIRGNPVLALGANVPGTVNWQIDTGVAITPHKNVITFSFLDSAHATGIYNNPNQGFTEQFGFSSFSAAQRAAGRTSINNWDELIAPTFKEVNGSGGADIVMANTTTGPGQAWAYYPYNYGESKYNHLMSDTWIASPSVNGSNAQLRPGQYGLHTLNHELGHTLGLSHPGAYNFGDGTGEITYATDAEYFQDSNQYSIMSYFDSYETGAQNIDWNLMRFIYPSTPMVHDVAVIQAKYGADMTTRTGNSVYGFNSTADVTNEAMKFRTGEMSTIFTIWDAAGNDTLDLSGYATDSVIDLREGAYSSAGGYGAYNPALIGSDPTLAQIDLNNAAAAFGPRSQFLFDVYFDGVDGVNEGLSWLEITGTGDRLLMEQNIGIAYGAVIENAIGGSGNDRINGNQANNVFTGNAGADTFIFAEHGSNDRSIDKVTDFVSGTDRIDLSSYAGVTISNVSFIGDTLRVDGNRDGDYNDVQDATFTILGTDVAAGDYIFG